MNKVIQRSVVVVTLLLMGSVVHQINKERVCTECRKKQCNINR
jgi:hypothetical protein